MHAWSSPSRCVCVCGSQTPLHFDDNNFGLTFLIAFDLRRSSPLKPGSGSHVLCSSDYTVGVQVRDSAGGVVTLGDYRRALHANRAVEEGSERLIVTAYCSRTLVERVNGR